jgi:hypothetical protein
VDVHGKFCRLLDEAEQVSKSEMRAKLGPVGRSEAIASYAGSLKQATSIWSVLIGALLINYVSYLTRFLNLLNT